MSAPTAPHALELYSTLGRGFTARDEENGWAASAACTALCAPRAVAAEVAADPSLWSDPTAAPAALIRPMAQRRGVRGAQGLSIDRLREIMAGGGAEVGSTAAIVDSVAAVLSSGVPRVRSGYNAATGNDEWAHTTVIVDPGVSPGSAVVRAAAELAAPDWVVIHYVEAAGDTVDELTGTVNALSGSTDEL